MRFWHSPRLTACEDLALKRVDLPSEHRRSRGWLGLGTTWFGRPLILGTAVLLMLLAATAYLAPRYEQSREAASASVRNSRAVITALDQVKTDTTSLTVKLADG